MSVTVHVQDHTDGSRQSDSFPDATSWHVDDERQLHITKGGSGNLASYSVNAWLSVRKD